MVLCSFLLLIYYNGMKEATDRITNLIRKCKKVAGSLHMSCKATELLEKEAGCQIPSANATRWNSTHAMLDAIVKAEEDHPGLLSRATAEAGSTVRFTAMDYAVLTEVCHLLHPFSDATKRLEAEDVPTSSLVIPAVIGIQNKMIKLNTPYCTSLKTGLTV